jgi:chromosome segregation ATPase
VHCPYESIKHYLHKQEQTEKALRAELQQVHKENESLRRQQTESKQQIETITHQLDLMFPGHFINDADIPEEARNESVLSENQRFNNELETLSANIASLELKQNMALMTETFRLQEELQSLRAICHGLRMQMHFIMMERKTTTTATTNNNAGSSSSSTGITTSGNNRGTAGNDTSVNGSLNRMRTWLGNHHLFSFY